MDKGIDKQIGSRSLKLNIILGNGYKTKIFISK